MDKVIEWIFLPIQPFLWHPERIAYVAVIFIAAFLIMRIVTKSSGINPRYLFVPAVLWTLFIPWEAYCKAGEYNIRVDLLYIYPVLMVTSVLGIAKTVKQIIQPVDADNPGNPPLNSKNQLDD